MASKRTGCYLIRIRIQAVDVLHVISILKRAHLKIANVPIDMRVCPWILIPE